MSTYWPTFVRLGVEWRPFARGGVIGIGLGRSVYAGRGVGVRAGAAALLCLCGSAEAGPEGARVVAGEASIRQNGDRTVIRAADRTIIDYTRFNIGAGESVRFIQPDAGARVLNRINSADPTRIDGTLRANGSVYFVNPAGVMFGPNSVVNVNQLYAAAGQMSDQDFLNGVNRFTGVTGEVVNQGRIETNVAALVGANVVNSGSITGSKDGSGGVVAMVAGEEVVLSRHGEPMSVRISPENAMMRDPSRPGVENTGTVRSMGGRVRVVAGDMYALAIRDRGMIQAADVKLEGRGSGRVELAGTTIDARDQLGTPGARTGGRVEITGEHVSLRGATIDARGISGGGSVLVGGGAYGRGTDRTASTTLVDRASTIDASAAGLGAGGTVVVWADRHTGVYGDIAARGGAGGGDGGFVETSGKFTLDLRGARVDASSAAGRAGTWLLDPFNVRITSAGPGVDDLIGTNYTPTGDDAQVSAQSISDALSMGMSGTNVVVTTGLAGSAGTQAGDLIVDAPITKNSASDATLRLEAARNITVNQAISASGGGRLNVELSSEGGVVGVGAPISTAGGSFSSVGGEFANGASITTAGGGVTIEHSGVIATGAPIDAGTGAVLMNSSAGPVVVGAAVGGGQVDLIAAQMLTLQGAVSAGTRALLTAADVDLTGAGSVSAGEFVLLQPGQTGDAIFVNDASGTGFSVSGDELSRITSSGDVVIGRVGGTGAMTIGGLGTIDLSGRSYNLVLRAGDISFSNAMGAGGIVARDNGQVSILAGGAITGAGGSAIDVTIGGDGLSGGGLLLSSGGATTLGTNVRRISGRSVSGDMTIVNTGSTAGSLEIVDLSWFDPIFTGQGLSASGLRAGNTATLSLTTNTSTVMTSVLAAARGTVNLSSRGNVFVLTGTEASIVADSLTLNSSDGLIGVGGALRTAVGSATTPGTLTATAAGAIDIDNSFASAALGSVSLNVGSAQLARLRNAGAITGADGVTWNAGSFDLRTTSGGVTLRGNLTSTGNVLIESAGTLTLQSGVALNAGGGTVDLNVGDAELLGGVEGSIVRLQPASDDHAIGLGAATGDLSLSSDELGRIVTAQLEIGGERTRQITAAGVSLSGDSAAGLVRLNAGRQAGVVVFNGGSSSFRTLEILARGGANLGANITANNGLLFIDGDTDSASSLQGDPISDRVVIGSGVTLDALTELIIQSPTAGLRGDGAVTLRGGDGVTLRHAYSNVAGSTNIDADTNREGPGLFTLASGATMTIGSTSANQSVLIVGADVDLGANINATGTVTIGRSTSGEMWLGNTTDATPGALTIGLDELARIEGTNAAFGGSSTTRITVAGLRNNEAGQTLSDRMRITGTITLAAGDLTITNNNLFAGQAGVVISRVNPGSVGVGTATGDMTIETFELDRIEATSLRITNLNSATPTDNTGRTVTVQDVSEEMFATISGPITFEAGDRLTLVDTGGGTPTRFRFRELIARANNGLDVRADVTTSTGDLTLIGDLDNTAQGNDRVTFFTGRTAASGRDLIIDGDGGATTQGALTLTAARDIAIRGNLNGTGELTLRADSDANGAGALVVDAGNTVRSDSNNVVISAADIRLGGATSATGAVSINAGGGSVSIDRTTGGTISLGAFDEAANAMGQSDPLTISNAELGRIIATGLTIGGNATSLLRVEGVTGAASDRIAGVTTLRALGPTGNINFDSAASTFNALTAEASSAVTVNRTLIADSGGVTLDGGAGTAELGDGLVNLGANVSGASSDDVNIRSGVTLTTQTVTVRGNDVTFSGTVDSDTVASRALVVNTEGGGATTFARNVGSTRRLATVRTDADGSVNIGGNVLASTAINFEDNAEVTAASPTIETTGGTGIRFGGNARVRGTIQSIGPTGEVKFRDAAILIGNTTINAIGGGDIDFIGRTFSSGGNHNLTLNVTASDDAPASAGALPPAIPSIRFGGAVGTNFQGQAAALGTLSLNPAGGRASVPRQATIGTGANTSDGLSFNLTGDFVMAQNEKLSVVGPLSITARKVTLGDVSASGDITVNATSNDADAIRLQARPRQEILGVAFDPATPSGQQQLSSNLQLDDGLDIISAFGRVTLSDRPQIVGSGPTPRIASVNGEVGGDLTIYDGLLIREFQASDQVPADRAADILRNGARLLDLSPSGPSRTNYATALAENPRGGTNPPTPVIEASFEETVSAALEELSITPRQASSAERFDQLVGSATFDDSGTLTPAGDPTGGAIGRSARDAAQADAPVVVNRLPAEPARTLAESAARVLGVGSERVERDASFRQELSGAISRYRAGAGAPGGGIVDPAALRAYLEQTPDERAMLARVRDVGEVLDRIGMLGLGPAEERRVRGRLLMRLLPEGEAFGRDMRTFERLFANTSRAAR